MPRYCVCGREITSSRGTADSVATEPKIEELEQQLKDNMEQRKNLAARLGELAREANLIRAKIGQLKCSTEPPTKSD